eukprot:Pgem_evm1s12595
MSGDDGNEVYFFTSTDNCKLYGNSFNPAVEVVFIRAPGFSRCYNVVRGGNAHSIRFSSPEVKNDDDDINKSSEGGASEIIVSTTLVYVVTAISK